MNYEAVIGLEVHAQLLTESKIFSSSSTRFGAEPNSQVNPVCLGLPGVLPVFNKKALEYAVKIGIITNCEIELNSRFDRKNYFYPDLPKGYQISQYEKPICKSGFLKINCENYSKKIRITRIHLEEDAGKLIHQDSGQKSYVDLNRAGVPLIEIVSEPDISTVEEAVEFVRKIRTILKYIGVCDGNMEEGSLRCDANVSIRLVGEKKLGTKTEIKNLNSFKFIQKALEYEINRQIAFIKNGKKIMQETRLFDSNKGSTFSMRSKEEAHDYRYFPDPDLLPINIEEEYLNQIKSTLPELPDARYERFVEQFSLPKSDAKIISSSRPLADYFEECIEDLNEYKTVSNWIINELLRELDDEDDISKFKVSPKLLRGLILLIINKEINVKTAKEVFVEMVSSGKPASEIVEKKGLKQISDQSEIKRLIKDIIENNPKEVKRYREGEKKLLGYFVGQVMKVTKGKANPKIVNDLLKKFLDDS